MPTSDSDLAALEEEVRGPECFRWQCGSPGSCRPSGRSMRRRVSRSRPPQHEPRGHLSLPGPMSVSTLVVNERNPGLCLKTAAVRSTISATRAGSADVGYMESDRYMSPRYPRRVRRGPRSRCPLMPLPGLAHMPMCAPIEVMHVIDVAVGLCIQRQVSRWLCRGATPGSARVPFNGGVCRGGRAQGRLRAGR
jgi:hypothetical protein